MCCYIYIHYESFIGQIAKYPDEINQTFACTHILNYYVQYNHYDAISLCLSLNSHRVIFKSNLLSFHSAVSMWKLTMFITL